MSNNSSQTQGSIQGVFEQIFAGCIISSGTKIIFSEAAKKSEVGPSAFDNRSPKVIYPGEWMCTCIDSIEAEGGKLRPSTPHSVWRSGETPSVRDLCETVPTGGRSHADFTTA